MTQVEYPWMEYEEIEQYIPEMERLKVSEVARGVKQSSVTDRGFLEVYADVQDPEEMYDTPIARGSDRSWGERRDNFVSRHYAQYQKNPTQRRRLALIAWAFDPEE